MPKQKPKLREFKMRPYRGLTKEGTWVYGWPVRIKDIIVIIPLEYIDDDKHCYWGLGEDDLVFELTTDVVEVIPKTVGQSTGRRDRKRTKEYPEGQEIYEGDIVKVDRDDSFSAWNQAIVVYAENRGAFILQYTKPINPKGFLADCSDMVSEDKTTLFGNIAYWKLEVIGDTHTTPELLEQDNG